MILAVDVNDTTIVIGFAYRFNNANTAINAVMQEDQLCAYIVIQEGFRFAFVARCLAFQSVIVTTMTVGYEILSNSKHCKRVRLGCWGCCRETARNIIYNDCTYQVVDFETILGS